MNTKSDLNFISEELLRHGISPRRTRRLIQELREHLEDITRSGVKNGLPKAEAVIQAEHQLGRPAEILQTILSRPELRSPVARLPWLFYVVTPLAAILALYGITALATFGIIETWFGGVPQAGWIATANTLLFIVACFIQLLVTTSVAWMAYVRRSPGLIPLTGLLIATVFGASLEAFIGFSQFGGYWIAVNSTFLPPFPETLIATITRTSVGLLVIFLAHSYFTKRLQTAR